MGAHLIGLLAKNFPGLKIECEVSVKDFSFIKTGGVAAAVLYPESVYECENIVRFLRESGIKYLILGRCSNVLFCDGYISDVLIKTDYMDKIEVCGESVYAECGARLSHLSLECAKHSLSGLEFACGIPGSVGGAVIMNAGAHGGQISGQAEQVLTDIGWIENSDCGFFYRESRGLTGRAVLAARFKLEQADRDFIDSVMAGCAKWRAENQPKGLSLGSTFKNPVGFSAGELIDKSGLKGFGFGGARVSQKHANFIVNEGGATSSDVKKLIDYIKGEVLKNFDIALEEEIRFIGGS